jgi:hypothetical protein
MDNVQNDSFLTTMLFARLYVKVVILLRCGQHLHSSIISLRGEIRAQKTNLTPSLFIEVAAQSGNIGFNDHPFDRLSLMRSVFIGEKQI